MSEPKCDDDVWMMVSELWQILRYRATAAGSHKAKVKAAERLQEFIDVRAIQRKETGR